VLRILIAAFLILGAMSLGPRAAGVAAENDPPPVGTDIPVDTANPFLPEEATSRRVSAPCSDPAAGAALAAAGIRTSSPSP